MVVSQVEPAVDVGAVVVAGAVVVRVPVHADDDVVSKKAINSTAVFAGSFSCRSATNRSGSPHGSPEGGPPASDVTVPR